MKWILIAVLAAKGGSGLGMWAQPALMSAAFEDRVACEQAAGALNAREIERATQLEYVRLWARCFPAGQGSGAK